MAKHLVIVESPAKARTINKFLGKDYVVKASMGHVRDLPTTALGVDLEKNFQPKYVNSKDKSKVIKELREAAAKCEDVLLAPDPDREGEAIAWHLRELLKKDVKGEGKFHRVTYNQITKAAILKAFSEPTELDMGKVDAQQARRVLDRIVGYQVSPLLWRRIRGGSSAGRVQTVALRLVCEREAEIEAFVPETYWIFGARAAKQVEPKFPFEIRLARVDGEKGELRDPELAARIQADLPGRTLTVNSIQRKEVSRSPSPPFITSTLQQAASNAFGYPPNRTMSLAQKLYEGVRLDGGGETGLITYMRTDSVHLAPEALSEIRAYIQSELGPEFLPEKPQFYRSRGNAQEAHEAIRVTDVTRTPDSLRTVLDPQELKLYTLIWNRTVACQMAPARIAQLTVAIGTDSTRHEYLFRASSSEILFPGFMRVTGQEAKLSEEDEALPPLREGEALDCLEWLSQEKQTQPPKRYSEAALIRLLEENGVGRPSTYASIVSTLYAREYVEREKSSLRPTKVGREVNDYLVGRLPRLFDVTFTAKMEEELDEVEQGKRRWTEMMGEFYRDFEGWVEEAKHGAVDMDEVQTLLGYTDAITEYAAPVKRGRRTYDDAKFVQDLKEKVAAGEKISDRQADNLRNVLARYAGQIDQLDEARVKSLGLQDLVDKASADAEPERPETRRKLELLQGLNYAEPRKVGKRTYDDKKFIASLAEQVDGGKRLSENQINALNRVLLKYAGQIPDFERIADSLNLQQDVEEDHESAPLLEMMASVATWNDPVKRGKRVWDDQAFYVSLRDQFANKKSLSERQRAALKKLMGRYHAQIPDYAAKREQLGLPDPNAPKTRGRKAPVE